MSLGVEAQNLRNIDGPAELPPTGFGGAQYVDSAGCVFVRAGVNGNTVWVPRVTRSRKLVCGHTPTFAGVSPSASNPAQRPVVQTVEVEIPRAAPPAPVRHATVVAAVRAPAPRPAANSGVMTMKGFRPAWSDGRLNPNRGPRTAQGDAQMALVWTNTVPLRLVAKR